MKLVIDIGNTRIKAGLFKANKLLDVSIYNDITPEIINGQINSFNIKYRRFGAVNNSIISSVRSYPEEIKNILKERSNFLELTPELKLPVNLLYATPITLGKDRIAIASAAAVLYPGMDILAIGAGTCITYDFVNKNEEYLGGGISPGIMMRFMALNTFTNQLPLVKDYGNSELIGNSTENSVLSGVMNGTVAEIDGIIERYRNKFPDLKIILTGGDSDYLAKNLKNDIFANSNLVLEGLNIILDYNVEA